MSEEPPDRLTGVRLGGRFTIRARTGVERDLDDVVARRYLTDDAVTGEACTVRLDLGVHGARATRRSAWAASAIPT